MDTSKFHENFGSDNLCVLIDKAFALWGRGSDALDHSILLNPAIWSKFRPGSLTQGPSS
jgi:hypothetical protein